MSQIPSHRVWVVRPDPETGEVNPAAVEQMALDVATVHRMCGGTVSSGAEREELLSDQNEPLGIFETVAMWWRWHPYAPGELEQAEQQRPQQASQRPRQRRSRGRGGRGKGGGNGQPPQTPAPAQPTTEAPGEAFANQVEPEPQEPPEAFEPGFDLEDDRPASEYMPLTDEQRADLRAQGALP